MYTGYFNSTWSDSVNHANSNTYRYNNDLMTHAERKAYEEKMSENRERAWYGRESNQ